MATITKNRNLYGYNPLNLEYFHWHYVNVFFFPLFSEMDVRCLLLVLAVGLTYGEKENVHHGAGHKPPSHMHHDHVDKDGEHNEHYDHEAILGKACILKLSFCGKNVGHRGCCYHKFLICCRWHCFERVSDCCLTPIQQFFSS